MEIRFLRNWHGRAVGQTDSRLNPAVMLLLIQQGIAERLDVPQMVTSPPELLVSRKRGRPRKA
jgi:hypothetical protein